MISEKLINIIADYYELNGDEREDITLDTNLMEICDELDLIEIVMEIEREFDIVVPNTVIGRLETVLDYKEYIEDVA